MATRKNWINNRIIIWLCPQIHTSTRSFIQSQPLQNQFIVRSMTFHPHPRRITEIRDEFIVINSSDLTLCSFVRSAWLRTNTEQGEGQAVLTEIVVQEDSSIAGNIPRLFEFHAYLRFIAETKCRCIPKIFSTIEMIRGSQLSERTDS